MYLKDVLYKQAVEGGADNSSGVPMGRSWAVLVCCFSHAAAPIFLPHADYIPLGVVCRSHESAQQASALLVHCAAMNCPLCPPAADDEAPAAAAKQQQQGRTYVQEQEELKKAFLSAFEEEVEAEGGDGGDGFGAGVLQARRQKKGAAAAEAPGSDIEDEAAGMGGGEGEGGESEAAAAARVQQLLDGYFGRDEQLSADDRFLKRYILNKVGGWAGWRAGGEWLGGWRGWLARCFCRLVDGGFEQPAWRCPHKLVLGLTALLFCFKSPSSWQGWVDEGDEGDEDEDYLAEHCGGEQVDEEEDEQWLEQAGKLDGGGCGRCCCCWLGWIGGAAAAAVACDGTER